MTSKFESFNISFYYAIIFPSFIYIVHELMTEHYKINIVGYQQYSSSINVGSAQVIFFDRDGTQQLSRINLNMLSGHIIKLQNSNRRLGLKVCIVENGDAIAKGQTSIRHETIEKLVDYPRKCELYSNNERLIFLIKFSIHEEEENKIFHLDDSYSDSESFIKKKQIKPTLDSPSKRIMKRNLTVMNNNHKAIYSYKPQGEEAQTLSNLEIDIDEQISRIKVCKDDEQPIAEFLFHKNPNQKEISGLQVDVGEEKNLKMNIWTIQNEKLLSSVEIPDLTLGKARSLNFPILDFEKDVRGEVCLEVKKDKRPHSPLKQPLRKGIDDAYHKKQILPPSILSEELPEMKKNAIYQNLPQYKKSYLAWENHQREKQKYMKLKLKKDKKNIGIYHKIINQKNSPEGRSEYFSIKTPQKRHKPLPSPTQSTQLKKIVKIRQVVVKFYQTYMIKHDTYRKEPFQGKVLQIYTHRNKIYRSVPVFGSNMLIWQFDDCQVHMNEFDNLICEMMSSERDWKVVGEVHVSFNHLKNLFFSYEIFKGYLTHKTEPIAKIQIKFSIKNLNRSKMNDQLNLRKRNNTTQQKKYSPEHFKHHQQNGSGRKYNLYYSLIDPINAESLPKIEYFPVQKSAKDQIPSRSKKRFSPRKKRLRTFSQYQI